MKKKLTHGRYLVQKRHNLKNGFKEYFQKGYKSNNYLGSQRKKTQA